MARRSTGNGRRARAAVTRDAILAATRRVMTDGNFRPTAAEIVAADGFEVRSIGVHFGTVETLCLSALDDATAHTIAGMVLALPDEISVARAIVLGRVVERRP